MAKVALRFGCSKQLKNLERYLNKTEFIYLSDSDDSDTEGGLGNVERVVMRPPGHSGKAKRGHLCFDSSFETGKGSIKNLRFYWKIKYGLEKCAY